MLVGAVHPRQFEPRVFAGPQHAIGTPSSGGATEHIYASKKSKDTTEDPSGWQHIKRVRLGIDTSRSWDDHEGEGEEAIPRTHASPTGRPPGRLLRHALQVAAAAA